MTGQPKRPPNKQIVRRSFDSAVEYAARLAAYSLAPLAEFSEEISGRAEKLAQDDLIVFAISARRLFDASGLTALSQSANVMELRPQMSQWHLALENWGNVPLRVVLNMIVHSDMMEISTYELHVLTLAGYQVPSEISIKQVLERDFRRIPPVVLLRSDREPYRFMRLSQVIDSFSNCLEDITNHCSKLGMDLNIDLDDN